MSDGTTDTETTTGTTEAPADVVAVDATATETTTEAEGGDTSTVLGGDVATEAAPEVVVPEAYELTAPEGVTLDPESIELATPIFKEMGLSNEAANKLMPVAADFANRAAAAALAKHTLDAASAFQTMNRENVENAKGDAEIGGAKWDETVTLSAKAMDLLGFPKGSPFREMLNETGLGNHPEMIRAFRRIGERVSEDSFATTAINPAVETNAARILYPNDKPKGA